MSLDLMLARFPLLLLIFMRFSGLFVTSPVLSSRYIPAQVKVMTVGFLSVFALPFIQASSLPGDVVGLALYAVNELAVGLAIGFVASAVLSAIQVAGQIIDTELGFGMVNVVDPQFGTPVPMFGNFYYLLALMLLIAGGGDRMIVAGLISSYGAIPVGAIIDAPPPEFVSSLASGLFAAGLRIAAPLLGALFMATLALGIVARTVPQMNVFMVGMPVKLVAGLALLAVTFPVYSGLVEGLTADMLRQMNTVTRIMAR